MRSTDSGFRIAVAAFLLSVFAVSGQEEVPPPTGDVEVIPPPGGSVWGEAPSAVTPMTAGATPSPLDVAIASIPPSERDPFWPVGYIPNAVVTNGEAATPVKPKPEEKPADWDEAMKQLRISGIMKMSDGGFVAVVNQRTVSEGDSVSVVYNSRTYMWQVHTIDANGVDFTQVEEEAP